MDQGGTTSGRRPGHDPALSPGREPPQTTALSGAKGDEMDQAELIRLAREEDPAGFQAALAASHQEAVATATGGHLQTVQTEAERHVAQLAAKEDSIAKLEANAKRLLEEKQKIRDERDELIRHQSAGEPPAQPGAAPQPPPIDLDALANERAAERAAEMLKVATATHDAEKAALEERLAKAEEAAELRLAAADKARARAFLIEATTGEGKPKPLYPHFLDHIEDRLERYVHWETKPNGDRDYAIRDGDVPLLNPKTQRPASYGDLVAAAYAGDGTYGFGPDSRAYFASDGTGGGAAATTVVPAGQVNPEQIAGIRTVAEYKKIRDGVMAA